MATLVLQQPHSLAKLADEVYAAHPELRGTLLVEGCAGERRVKDSGGARAHAGEYVYVTLPADPPNTVRLSWPDDVAVDAAALSALVRAHNPTPLAPKPTLNQLLAALLAQMAAAADFTAIKPALADAARALDPAKYAAR